MTGWIILLTVLAVLLLVSLIRLGGRVTYGVEGFDAEVIVGPLHLQLFPRKTHGEARPKKEKRKKKEKTVKKKAKEGKKGGSIGSRVMELLPLVAEAAGALKRKIRIDYILLAVVWGAEDPASAAIGYGRANAALGMMWPLLDNNFKVKKCEFKADVDYGRTSPEFTVDASITITVGQLVSFVVIYGVKLLTNWVRSGKDSAEEQEVK